MKSLNISLNFISFALVGFGPVVIAYIVLALGLLLNVFITLLEAAYTTGIQFFFVSLIIILFLGSSIWMGFYLFKKSHHWLAKVLILYGFWLILADVPIFFLFSSLAGVSMAAVDNPAMETDFLPTVMRESLRLLLLANLVIVPWVTGAGWVMKRLGIDQPAAAANGILSE